MTSKVIRLNEEEQELLEAQLDGLASVENPKVTRLFNKIKRTETQPWGEANGQEAAS